MGHSHSHHQHHHATNKKVLFWSFIIIFSFMIIEAVGGILTNSLALLSDAGHMLSDAAALGLTLLAFKIGEKSITSNKTFGYKRFEIIAAFINGVTLMLISVFIFIEAFRRFAEPPEVSGSMMIIAFIGLCVNILVAWLLMRGNTKENLNLKSALLHVMGDLLGSVGALIAGGFILLFNWHIADPIASVIVAVLIIISATRITKDSLHILMEGKPDYINIDTMKDKLTSLSGVKDVHDIHVWSITSEFPSMSCHLLVYQDVDRDHLLQEASDLLRESYRISHSTIQIEGRRTSSCESCAYD